MGGKTVAAVLVLFGGIAYGGKLPEGLRLIKTKKEIVTHYTYTVTKDGVKAVFDIVKVGDKFYGLPMKLENGEFKRIEPRVSLVPVNADFLSKVFLKLEHVVGDSFRIGKDKRKPTLFIVFDSMCPYCMKALKGGELQKLKENYNLVFLPLAVHGKASIDGLSCIYTLAKKEGMEGALKEVFSWKDGKSWEKYEKKLSSCKVDGKVRKTVEEVSQQLLENGVFATPTFFLNKNGKFYKRVGVPDFSRIER